MDILAADLSLDLIDRICEHLILDDLLFHFGAGAHDRGMIAAAEFVSDLDIGDVKQLSAEIDGNVSGIGNVLGSCLGCDLLSGQTVIISDGLDDFLRGKSGFIRNNCLVFQRVHNRFKTDRAAVLLELYGIEQYTVPGAFKISDIAGEVGSDIGKTFLVNLIDTADRWKSG